MTVESTVDSGSGEEIPKPRMHTVLIAEDAAHVRGVCRVILIEYGYCVIEAANGREAVTKFLWHRPDVVVLDINMPEVDGLAALAQIKQFDPGARVIMLTALG